MLLHHTSAAKIALHLAAMATISGLLLHHTRAAHAELDTNSAYLVSSRSSLRMCVQVSAALSARSAIVHDRLHQSLHTLRSKNPGWERRYGANTPDVPILETSCKIKIPNKPFSENDLSAVGLGNVITPSPYRTVFLVLDEATATTVLGDRKASLAPYEMMQISEHENVEVTNAVVIRESAIDDPQVIHQYIAIATGIEPLAGFAPTPPEGETSPTIKPQERAK